MSESITTVIELPELRSRIKAEDSKARNIAKKSLAHVIECGLLLIELKARVNHGHWKYEARQLNMSPRTISNYMKIARNGNVAVLGKGVRDALRLLSIAENPPPAKPTTTVLPEPPAPSPRLPQITVDAEIVEPAAPATAPAQAPLETKVEIEVETKVDEPPAAPVRLKTTSPASPSQSAAILVFEIYKLLPKMSEEDLKGASASLTELVGVIESRWTKGGRP